MEEPIRTSRVCCRTCRTQYDAGNRHSAYRHRKAHPECNVSVNPVGRPREMSIEDRKEARRIYFREHKRKQRANQREQQAPTQQKRRDAKRDAKEEQDPVEVTEGKQCYRNIARRYCRALHPPKASPTYPDPLYPDLVKDVLNTAMVMAGTQPPDRDPEQLRAERHQKLILQGQYRQQDNDRKRFTRQVLANLGKMNDREGQQKPATLEQGAVHTYCAVQADSEQQPKRELPRLTRSDSQEMLFGDPRWAKN